MSSQSSFLDSIDWPLPKSSYRTPSLDSDSLSPGSETASIHFSHYPLPPTPISSRSPSEKGRGSIIGTDLVTRVPLQRPVYMYVDCSLSILVVTSRLLMSNLSRPWQSVHLAKAAVCSNSSSPPLRFERMPLAI
jgi:hypothetical protein